MSSAVAVTLCAGRAARGAACSCDAAACLSSRRKTCCAHVCSVRLVALCLRFYFEVKSPVLLLVEKAEGRWARSRGVCAAGCERCRTSRSVWPRLAPLRGAAGSDSEPARRSGRAGLAEGRGRTEPKVCAVSELPRQLRSQQY